MVVFNVLRGLFLESWLLQKPKLLLRDTGSGIHLGNGSQVTLENIVIQLDSGYPVAMESLQTGDSIDIPYEVFGTSETVMAITLKADNTEGEVVKMVEY